MKPPRQGRRYLVKGRVQGVFFRDSTRRVAERLGITGHAINLADGSVEVVCYGAEQALDELENWLGEGPPMSRVTAVDGERLEADANPPSAFRTG